MVTGLRKNPMKCTWQIPALDEIVYRCVFQLNEKKKKNQRNLYFGTKKFTDLKTLRI